MTIEKTTNNGVTVFLLDGKIDAITAPELHTQLVPEIEAVKNVELDFTNISYISSAGLRVLVLGDKAAKAAGGKMTLRGVAPKIMEIFVMTGFKKILTFV